MEYNHKSQPKTPTETAFIQIDEIQRKPIKDGTAHIITLCGRKGERYTGFERVWLEQKIDMAKLNEGDYLRVDYVRNGQFLNFVHVEIPPSVEEELATFNFKG